MLQVKVIVGRRMCGGGWISNVLNFYELHLKPGVTIDNNIRYLLCQACISTLKCSISEKEVNMKIKVFYCCFLALTSALLNATRYLDDRYVECR